MDAEQPQAEKICAWHWVWFLFWPSVFFVFYFLFSGPMVWMVDKGTLSNSNKLRLARVYAPLEWAYDNTLFHKPIGIYLHLWSGRFDQHGEVALGGVD